MLIDAIAGLAFGIWAYLIVARGGFWLASVRDDTVAVAPSAWPAVAVVIPARNEADVIARSVGSLLRQAYPGPLSVTVVDDDSDDGTGEAARAAAVAGGPQLTVVRGQSLPAGWTGKLWAMTQGVAAASARAPKPEFLLLTDADIAHTADNVRSLVEHAMQGGYVLTSLMAKLRCAESRRAGACAGLHLFLPDALSVPLGGAAKG